MNCDLLIENCCLLEGETLREKMDVAIAGDSIAAVQPHRATAFAGKETIDAAGKLLLPGFVDGHTHVCQQLLRGRVADEYPMIWTRILVPFENTLTAEDVRVSTQLACLEMIRSGITSFADAGGPHMDAAASVVVESGMRAALCRSTMDMGDAIPAGMKENAEAHIRHTRAFHTAWQGKGEGRLDIWFGLRQVMTCSPALIRATAENAAELATGIHAHLCEHKDEVSFCLQHYQKRPAALLDELGVLGPNLLTAHNVVLSEGDITLMAKRDVKVIHCPAVNLMNHGFPKTPRILEAGLTVGLGNDGASGVALDMFEQLRALKYATAAQWGLPVFDPVVLPTAELLKMPSQGGAAALQKRGKLGAIAPDMLADMILLDINQPHMVPSQKPAATLIACGNSRDITHTIINGKVVMRNREVLTLDAERIMAEAKAHMQAITARV